MMTTKAQERAPVNQVAKNAVVSAAAIHGPVGNFIRTTLAKDARTHHDHPGAHDYYVDQPSYDHTRT